MVNFIPSKDVRDFIVQADREFTDSEKATIIYNVGLPAEVTYEELKKIADNTEDEVLKMQIAECIKSGCTNNVLLEDVTDIDDIGQSGFENAYIDIPNPFERGDIVRIITDGRHGIVSISKEDWKKYNELVKAADYADFSDASIPVDFITDSGSIVHNHICPMFLEKYEPAEGDKDCDILLAGSGVYTGNCGLDWFAICYDAYKYKIEERCNNN